MATIELDQEILDVEIVIDDGNYEEAFRQIVSLRDRFGRRPEYRYIKALFDMSFGNRTDKELISDVRGLVAEQPDFLEAVSILAVLLNRTGEREAARVFAREAALSKNERTQARLRPVLGDAPIIPGADEAPFFPRIAQSDRSAPTRPDRAIAMTSNRAAPTVPANRPFVMPTPGHGGAYPRETKALVSVESNAPAPPAAPTDPFRLPSEPPPLHDFEAPKQGDTLEGLPRPASMSSGRGLQGISDRSPDNIPSVPPGVIGSGTRGSDIPGVLPRSSPPSNRPMTAGMEVKGEDFIPFSPSKEAMPPPPTIPPPPSTSENSARLQTRSKSQEKLSPIRNLSPPFSTPPSPIPPNAYGSSQDLSRGPSSLPMELAVDRTGIGADIPKSRHSRPAIAVVQPLEQVRGWFEYARENQIQGGEEFSTARTLLDLCERVVEGSTPLAAEPIPLDRRGLILVERRLESLRQNRGKTVPAAERNIVTGAAFLLGLLLKECDGKAIDTPAEDGACKVVLPTGSTVRPLFVTGAFVRSRGPGLVESFDRAATSHMGRSPIRRTSASFSSPPLVAPPTRFDLTVLRRDLDASTLGVIDPDTTPGPRPSLDLRKVASDFWSTEIGREIASSSRRIGSFTIADIDAIERYASKTHNSVGFAPPGTPWPWVPDEDLDDLILSWGAVLGEVLVSLYSGRWEADPGNYEDRHLLRVVLSGGVVAWPVAKAYMRLARGIPHDLSVYVDAVGRVVGREALNP